ncbi:hypothetical protein [Defluviimonas sp. WL0075]|nr:hypothetical protein [Defluviimonas sp. WL0075]
MPADAISMEKPRASIAGLGTMRLVELAGHAGTDPDALAMLGAHPPTRPVLPCGSRPR